MKIIDTELGGTTPLDIIITFNDESNEIFAENKVEILDTQYYGVCQISENENEYILARTGYTGEDGFELATNSDDALELAQLLLDQPEVEPTGLGARDSLRLEAGLCLHGNDIHPNITPVVAGLSWAIPASRRKGGSRSGGFLGSESILLELANCPSVTRVGIQPEGRAPVEPEHRPSPSKSRTQAEPVGPTAQAEPIVPAKSDARRQLS